MSRRDNHHPPGPSAQTARDPDRSHPDDPRGDRILAGHHMVHELANLLDGSLRNLDLACTTLQDATDPSADAESVLRRLRTTQGGLARMGLLLRRWRDGGRPLPRSGSHPQTLAQAVEQAVELLRPATSQQRIELSVNLAQHAAELPAGPVFTIVTNAVRNSIQAIADQQPDAVHPDALRPRIEVLARVGEGFVDLRIRDNGPGLDPVILDDAGHVRIGSTTKTDGSGIGLQVCHDVAQGVGGFVTLANCPPRGAVFLFRYPLPAVVDGTRASRPTTGQPTRP